MESVSAPRKYPDEVCDRAVNLVCSSGDKPAIDATAASRKVGDQLGVHPETLRNWVRQAEIDGGCRPGLSTDDTERIRGLERENLRAAPCERDP